MPASGSWAAAQDPQPGQALANRQSADVDVDADGDGRLTADEFAAYGDLVFVSMDSEESGGLAEQEFTSWGFGMQNPANEAGAPAEATTSPSAWSSTCGIVTTTARSSWTSSARRKEWPSPMLTRKALTATP